MDDNNNERPFKMVLGGVFLVFLVLQGVAVKEMTYPCIFVGLLLIAGYILNWGVSWQKKREREKFEASFGVGESGGLAEVAGVVSEHKLEVRIRKNTCLWDVTLFSTEDKLHRMVGKGRGETMTEALEGARKDFTSKLTS